MSQNYYVLQPADSLQASRLSINRTHEAIASNFEGSAFPTLNLFAGMQCYRSDERRMYTLRTLTPTIWVVTQKLNDVFISRTDADGRYHRLDMLGNGNLLIGGSGSGVNDLAFVALYPYGATNPVFRLTKDSNQDFHIHRYNPSNGNFIDTPLSIVGGELQSKGFKVWHSNNDGSGSGLDADVVRGTAPGSFGLTMLAAANVDAGLNALGLANGLGLVGDIKARYGAGVIPAWVLMNGLSIGRPGSGAQQRANDDCWPLFNHLWYNDGTLTVYGGRGASAQADWNAYKHIATPDMRGRTLVGREYMESGSPGNRLPGYLMQSQGIDSVGGWGGSATVTLTTAQIPPHNHGGVTTVDGWHGHGYLDDSTTGGGLDVGLYISSFVTRNTIARSTDGAGNHQHGIPYEGGGSWHSNMQPFMLVSFYIKL